MRLRTKELSKSKGITLVALVVTIIVLLILAGIAINFAMGEKGIFTRAFQAVKEHKKQTYFEELNLDIGVECADRIITPKEEPLILSLKNIIQEKSWVENVIMCNNNLEEKENIEDNTVLIIETKDGYEIIIDVNNVELTAKIRDTFEKVGKIYKIKYNANGGKGEIEEQKVKAGFSCILRANAFTKDNNAFVGWCANKNGQGEIYAQGSKYKPNSDTTLYAIWKQNTVVVRIVNVEGDEIEYIQDIEAEPNSEITLPQNTLEKEGETFKGWNTNIDGTGTEYKEGEKIKIGEEDVILYTQWQEVVTATINFNKKTMTEGTTITIGGTALASKIENIELKLGNTIIYSENITQDVKTYTKELKINNLSNLINLEFYNNYTAILKVKSKNNTEKEVQVTQIKNNLITKGTDLKKLATLVNSNTTFEGETILQVSNIDLSAICSSSKGNWIPIGYRKLEEIYIFQGTYNGNNLRIDNIYFNGGIDSTYGLFGVVGSKGIVKNVDLYGTMQGSGGIDSRTMGGIVGRNEGIVEGCTNNANITRMVLGTVGGIVGYNLNIVRNCINKGNVTGKVTVGGIVGGQDDEFDTSSKYIQGCINMGNITGSYQVGGIAGRSLSQNIEKCKNSGNVISNKTNDNPVDELGTGGIVGRAEKGANIIECSNTGNVTQTVAAFSGGIVGFSRGNTVIDKCYNYNGCIKAKGNAAGGIVGRSDRSVIKNCYNYLSSNNYYIKAEGINAGGIVGVLVNNKTQIYNCYNIGENISATSNVGAICGENKFNETVISNCYYLSSSLLKGIGTKTQTLATNNITQKPDIDFKSSSSNTASVVYLLNSNTHSNSSFLQSSSINGGYPYIKSNIPN